MSADAYKVGIIGGSGLYGMEELEVHEERAIETPFGSPSDAFVLGELSGRRVAFLARHGRGHRILPSELNFRANIYAFKTLGTERLISLSAVGSLRRRYQPTHIVVPDQFIDRTRHRPDTFFGNGLAAHVAFADPICPVLMEVCADQSAAAGAVVHRGGTYVCMEGPQFSTRAESFMHRELGRGRDRHDEPAGGEARAGGGDLLLDARPDHGLRLLARGGRGRHRRCCPRRAAAERAHRPGRGGANRRGAAGGTAGGRRVPARMRWSTL